MQTQHSALMGLIKRPCRLQYSRNTARLSSVNSTARNSDFRCSSLLIIALESQDFVSFAVAGGAGCGLINFAGYTSQRY